MKFFNNIIVVAICLFFISLIGCSSGQIEPTDIASDGEGTDTTDGMDKPDTTAPVLFSVTAITSKSFFQLIIPWIGSPSVSALTLADFNCAEGGDPETVVCECPAGGTATSSILNDSTLFTEEGDCSLEGLGSIAVDLLFLTNFEDCGIEVCGSTVSINGDVGTLAIGEIACEANPVVLFSGTEEELDCEEGAALTISVDEEEIANLIFSLQYDPTGDGFSGELCTDEGLLPFGSFEELLTALGEDLSCSPPQD